MKNITKDQFVSLLDEAGIAEAQRHRLHVLFEEKHPEGHQAFLEFLSVPPDKIAEIRRRARAS